jgi:hypothetical protein
MIKHYVEFFYPGIMFTEFSVEKVSTRRYNLIKAPKECFGFRFFSREEIKKGKRILKGKKENYSGRYYFGKIYTLKQIKKKLPREKCLIRNIKRSDTQKGLKTDLGNWQIFDKRDKLIRR